MTVNSWQVDTATGKVTYDLNVDGRGLAEPGAPCQSTGCTWRLEGWYRNGTTSQYQVTLDGRSMTPGTWSFSVPVRSADQQLPEITDLRVTLTAGSATTPAYTTAFVHVSSSMLADYDLAAAAAAAEAATATGDPCENFLLEPGPHTQGSSLPDTYLDCEAGTGSWGARVLQLAVKYGVPAVEIVATATSDGHIHPDPNAVQAPGSSLIARDPTGKITTQRVPVLSRNCLQFVARAGIFVANANPCEDRPVFSPGSNVPSATQHDYDAIFGTSGSSGTPGWLQLHYVSGADKNTLGQNRKWFLSQPECANAQPFECDEYPYFTSAEGGPPADPRPSLRKVVPADNRLEGSILGGFVSGCKLRSDPAGGNAGTAYLVIPMPGTSAPPTLWACGPPNAS